MYKSQLVLPNVPNRRVFWDRLDRRQDVASRIVTAGFGFRQLSLLVWGDLVSRFGEACQDLERSVTTCSFG